MEQNKTTYAMIRSAVEKGILDIRQSPRRGIRNLVELGELFAKGEIQKEFFHEARRQLKNERSAYYEVVSRLFRSTSSKVLTSFGMNLGYNCWTRGARQIREREARDRFNIPWCLLLEPGDGSYLTPAAAADIVNQGKALGIHCYMLFVDEACPEPDGLLELLAANDDCACALFISPSLLTRERIRRIRTAKTILTAVELNGADPATEAAIAALLEAGCLCGGFARYRDLTACAEETLPMAAALRLPFLFFADENRLPPLKADAAGNVIAGMREMLKYPVFPVDLYRDIALIDRNISSEACVAAVLADGTVTLADAEAGENRTGHDLRNTALKNILARALPKHRTPKSAPTAG